MSWDLDHVEIPIPLQSTRGKALGVFQVTGVSLEAACQIPGGGGRRSYVPWWVFSHHPFCLPRWLCRCEVAIPDCWFTGLKSRVWHRFHAASALPAVLRLSSLAQKKKLAVLSPWELPLHAPFVFS